jgi:hypothetical protein
MMARIPLLVLVAVLIAGCGAVSVQPLSGQAGPARDVCLD